MKGHAWQIPRFRRIPWHGIGICLALALPAGSQAAPCDFLQDWITSRNALTSAVGTGIRKYEEAQQAEWKARTRATQEIVQAYFAGQSVDLNSCLMGLSSRQNFLDTLQSAFFEESLARLRQARSPSPRKMMAAFDQRFGSGNAALFRMTGHSPDQPSPTAEKGGFHRGSASIFMDVSRIPSPEWLLIFTHELLHSLDPLLMESVQAFSKPQLLLRLGDSARTLSDPAQLAPADRVALARWLEAGLGRGLWAEYRAWVVTLAIYPEGLDEGLWPRIEWVERILAERKPQERLDQFTYRYLDARSEDPTEGIFSRPLIQRALSEVRQRARTGNPPELGALGSFLPRSALWR